MKQMLGRFDFKAIVCDGRHLGYAFFECAVLQLYNLVSVTLLKA